MGKISKAFKETFFKDDFRVEQRLGTLVKDVVLIGCFVVGIITFCAWLFGNPESSRSALSIIKWIGLIMLGIYVIGLAFDIKNFPLHLIYLKLFKHREFVEDITAKITDILIKNPKTNICYIVEYLCTNSYYPVFIIGNKQYVSVDDDDSITYYNSDRASVKYGIYLYDTEELAISKARRIFTEANNRALRKLNKERQMIITKKNTNIDNMNIKLALKAKYNKPIIIN